MRGRGETARSRSPRRTRVCPPPGKGRGNRRAHARARARVCTGPGSEGLLERLARLLAGRQVMRVTMATHQRKCILQETLIPSPRSWDSLTFHSHTVIRYQLSVQGGRLRGCSPAGGGCTKGWGGTWGGGPLKTQGRFAAVRPVHPPPCACPRTWRPARSGAPPIPRAPAARAPVHPLPPGSCPASSLSTHLPCSALHPDAAHLSFVRGGTTETLGTAYYVPGAVPSLGSCSSPRPSEVSASLLLSQGSAGCGHLLRVMQTCTPILMAPIWPRSYNSFPSHL